MNNRFDGFTLKPYEGSFDYSLKIAVYARQLTIVALYQNSVPFHLASNGKKKSEKTYGSSANPLAYILGVSVYKVVVDSQ